jgi:hypothetical protein
VRNHKIEYLSLPRVQAVTDRVALAVGFISEQRVLVIQHSCVWKEEIKSNCMEINVKYMNLLTYFSY